MAHKNGKSDTPASEFSSPLQFPCDFVIKVMGKADDTFEGVVMSIIGKHFPQVTEEKIQRRPSKDNNYLALTIKVHAENKEQLDAVYQELSDAPEVLMAL